MTLGLVWRRLLWVVLPAVASVPAFGLAPKWQLFYVAAAFVAVPIALTVRDEKPWLFLAGALSAFNITKVIGEPATTPTAEAVAISAVDIPIVMLLAMALVRATSSRDGGAALPPSVRKVLLMGVVFVGWIALAAIGRRPEANLAQALSYARVFIALGVVAACTTDTGRLRWALWGLFLALFAQSAIAVAQFVTGSSFGLYEHFEATTAAGTFTRSGGTLNPTVLSEFIGVVAPLVLAMAFTSRRRALAAGLLALFGAAAMASLMTLSRAGLFNLAITASIVLAVAFRSPAVPRLRKLVVGWTIPAFAVVLAVFFSDALMARFGEIDAEVEGDEGRGVQLVQAQQMIVANPLLGVGPGNYVGVMGQYGPTLPYPVHNKFLLITAEAGIPAGVVYIAVWMFILSVFVRRTMGATGREKIFHAAAAATLVATLLNMNTDVYGAGGAPELALFLVAGLALGFGERRTAPRVQEDGGWETSWNRSAPAR